MKRTICSHDAEHASRRGNMFDGATRAHRSMSTQVNHAVLAVGYGVDPVSSKPYWLIKNSWDYTWGDSQCINQTVVAHRRDVHPTH